MVIGTPTVLNLIPGGVMKVIHVNQVNENIEIQFRIMNGAQPFNVPEGVSCTIRGTKGDNFGYAAAVAVTAGSNIVTVTLTEQLTAVAGAGNVFELVFVGASDNMKVSTENFILEVERAALGEDTVISDSDLAYADQVLDQLQSVGAVNAQVQQNKANIAAEITRATAAEQTLQQNINAEAAARQAADNTLQSNINAEASSRATTDASLQSQINQLVAPSGEAPSAAEVQNARIGTDGTVYPTLGDAIRTQNSDLKSHIDFLYKGEKTVSVTVQGGYSDAGVNNGLAARISTQIIPVNANSVAQFDFGSLKGVVMYWRGSVSSANYSDSGNWRTGTYTQIFDVDGYFALVCKNSTDTSLVPSAFDGSITLSQVSISELASEIDSLPIGNMAFATMPTVENLYNPNDEDIQTGKEISNAGVISEYAELQVSGFIPCEQGDVLTFPVYTNHFGTGSAVYYISSYNADKTFVRSVQGVLSDSFLTLTIPNNYGIKYIRINVARDNANSAFIITPYHSHDNFMVIKGNAMPNRFVPYNGQPLFDSNIYSAHENLNNPLYAKKVVFLGDSICEGGGADTSGVADNITDKQSGWAGRIGIKNTMLWENGGLGGSTIAATSSGKTICTKAIKMSNPDYIIFEGGTNDADRIGNILGDLIPQAFGTFSEDNYGTDDATTYYGFDINTFCGAFDYLCKRLISNYTGAKIGYIVAQKMGLSNSYTKESNNRRAYFEYAIKFCEKWGISYINLWDGCYLNPQLRACYDVESDDSLYADGQHLLAKGYDYITPIIESWMKSL